jgi:very-short-patch-repair endonuclease
MLPAMKDGEGLGPPVRGHIRRADHRRVSHGLFLRIDPAADPESDDEALRELHAWLLVLPPGAAFTHLTGAWLRGWHLPILPEQVPVFAAVGRMDSRPRRPGLICSRLERTAAVTTARCLPVEPATEILLRAARDLGLLDLVVLVDSARRRGDVIEAEMAELLAGRRPGVRLLREAWRLSITKSDSAGESVLRMFHEAMGVPVKPQAILRDEAGNVVGQADLLVTGTNRVHEYDGAHHRAKKQQRTDLRRGRGLAQWGYDRRGFTLDDLLNHPAVVMHELDRELGRTHSRRRLDRWRAWLGQSLYCETGRQRILNRWKRQMGVVEWVGTTRPGA